MKAVPIFKVSGALPVFSRIFPHRLKYHMFGTPILKKSLLRIHELNDIRFDVTRFSTRASQGMQESKSLIEDEAELSDWVSGLSSSSFKKTRVYSDSENDEGNDKSVESGRYGRSRERDGKRPRGSTFDRERKNASVSPSRSLDRESGFRDSSKFSPRRGSEKFGRRLDEKSERGGSVFSKGNDLNLSKWGRENKDSRQTRSEFGDVKFMSRREETSKRNENTFGRGNDLRTSERWKDNEARGRQKEMWNGRDGDGASGSFQMKRERPGEERKGNIMNVVKRGRGGAERRGSILNDDDDDDEDETENGYKNFKGLIDSDEVDDDNDDVVDNDDEDEEEDETGGSGFTSKGIHFSQLQQSSPGKSDSCGYLSEIRFDQCSISPLSLKAIKDVGFEKMTLVQEATLPIILKGKDVLAKAKTGTGKTVAFLLPAIELVLQSPPVTRDQKRPPILVLVICPTRELANQAAAEANNLLKYHPSIGVQVVIGGTRLALEQKRMQANPCQILVATPGRLRDHVENTAGFATRMMGVKILVLDEADHLLDMGFRKEIEKIIAAVPKQRQTLLFSATIPDEVRQICHVALRRDHEFINTVQEGSEDTHSQVKQMHLVAALDKHFSLLYTLLKDHIANDVNYKILVFCTTAMVTKLVAEILKELNLNVREIHSRKSQSVRTRISDEFRKSKGLILVTSDVSARGVDYPDVTLVVQMGVPADREQYIHRLGRTGRKGKEGEGILLLAPWEEFFLSSVKDLPISKASEPAVDPDTYKKVSRALSHVEIRSKEAAYQAWLGYYNSNKNVGRDKYKLVELANEFSRSMGLDNPPAITKLVLGKMGLKNIPGLRTK